jgi:hypothetical protein
MRGGFVTATIAHAGDGRTGAKDPGRWSPVRAITVAATLGLGVLLAAAQDQADQPGVKTYPEIGVTLLDESVADVAWSRDGRWLAYPKRDALDLYMKIWASRPDGTLRRCLTCDPPPPAKHCGGVTWHPSGDYMVFSAENDDVRTRKADRLAEPGVGLNTNLWAMTADGSRAWPLTHDATDDEDPRGSSTRCSRRTARASSGRAPSRYRMRKGFEWGEGRYFSAISAPRRAAGGDEHPLDQPGTRTVSTSRPTGPRRPLRALQRQPRPGPAGQRPRYLR